MIYGNRRHSGELLAKSEGSVASNSLADRLERLANQGIVTRPDDPSPAYVPLDCQSQVAS